MLTDIFASRYPNLNLRDQFFEDDRRFLHQISRLITGPLWGRPDSAKEDVFVEASLKSIHDRVATEYGTDWLSDRGHWYNWGADNKLQNYHTNNYAAICKKYLEQIPPDITAPDGHIMARLSFIEQAFQLRYQQVAGLNASLSQAVAQAEAKDAQLAAKYQTNALTKTVAGVKSQNAFVNTTFKATVDELNERLIPNPREADSRRGFPNRVRSDSTS